MFYLATASPFFAFEQSDLFGRFVVIILALLSVTAWTIIIEKWIFLRQAFHAYRNCLSILNNNATPKNVVGNLHQFAGPLRNVLDSGLRKTAALQQISVEQLVAGFNSGTTVKSMSDTELELVAAAFEEAVDDEVMAMEENLNFLGSIVSSSPFLGLLGTVWGVMMAFTGMALKGKADINAIAPGVSGALLTTVVALLVAIPALIGYNQLSGSVRVLTIKIDHFSDTFVKQLKSSFHQ